MDRPPVGPMVRHPRFSHPRVHSPTEEGIFPPKMAFLHQRAHCPTEEGIFPLNSAFCHPTTLDQVGTHAHVRPSACIPPNQTPCQQWRRKRQCKVPALFTSGVKTLYYASTYMFIPEVSRRTCSPRVGCHTHCPTTSPSPNGLSAWSRFSYAPLPRQDLGMTLVQNETESPHKTLWGEKEGGTQNRGGWDRERRGHARFRTSLPSRCPLIPLSQSDPKLGVSPSPPSPPSRPRPAPISAPLAPPLSAKPPRTLPTAPLPSPSPPLPCPSPPASSSPSGGNPWYTLEHPIRF